ncbi:MAG: antibiotic biosynthesis monooxygenase [Kiritimatiellae bacterium]|nr:antibiotic biosynthesis monooxygenase [Kiritimatiellia bacterium]
MIHVAATIEVVEGKRAEFLAIFKANIPNVRAEAGCIEYGVAVDVATGLGAQKPVRANTAVAIEKWASVEALKAHLAAPHMAAYREKVKELVKGVELRVLEPA